MQKCIGLLKQTPGSDRAAFGRQLLDQTAPALLASPKAPARLIVNLVDEEQGSPGDPRYDAVIELWLSDLADLPALISELSVGAAWFYHVGERVQLDHGQSWPLGSRSPGVKAVCLTRRPEGLDAREAARLWREHARLARTHHVGMWKYVQNGVIDALTPDAPVVHGVAELHFPTREDYDQRLYDSEEGQAAIRADAARIVGEVITLLTGEYILRA